MKTTIPITVLALGLAGLSLLGAEPPAAATPPPPNSSFQTHVQVFGEAPPKPTFDLAFAGGNIDQLVKAIEKASGRPVNILVLADQRPVRIPRFNLKGVDEDTLFSALSALRLEDGNVRLTRTGAAWVVQAAPDNRVCSTFYVGHLLKKHKVEDVSTAIRTTWEMGRERGGELKFHSETGLLFVLADKGQIAAVTSVLSEIRRGVEEDEAMPALKALETRCKELVQELDQRTKAYQELAAKQEQAYRELAAMHNKLMESLKGTTAK